jgi:hypothetical protein
MKAKSPSRGTRMALASMDAPQPQAESCDSGGRERPFFLAGMDFEWSRSFLVILLLLHDVRLVTITLKARSLMPQEVQLVDSKRKQL